MAKNLPYFKFFSSEWNDGDITLEDFNLQGLFISICSYYWSREGHITKKHLVKRFRNTELIEELFTCKYLKQRRDKVCIGFLDEQMKEHENRAQSSRENGKLGGRPKGNPEKPSRLLGSNPEEPNKEEEEDKTKIREDNIYIDSNTPLLPTSIDPKETEKPYNRLILDYMEIYQSIKSFSQQKVFGKIQHALHEAVSICGNDRLMQSVNDYAYYMADQPKQKEYASSPVNFLVDRQYNTDWLMRTEGCYSAHTIPDSLIAAFTTRTKQHPDMEWEN